jgi:hypothetical protein
VLEHVISSVQHIATHVNAKLEESEERVLSKMKTTMADMYEKIDLLNAAVSPGGTKAQDDTTITPDSEDVHEIKSLEFVTQRVSEASRDMEGRAQEAVPQPRNPGGMPGPPRSKGKAGMSSEAQEALIEKDVKRLETQDTLNVDSSMLRSRFTRDDVMMMQEIFNVTNAPLRKDVRELTGAIKSLVGAAGAPGGDDGDSSDSDKKHPKRLPGKDKGKPTAKKKDKHKDEDPGSDGSEDSGADKRRKSKLPDGPAKTIDLFNKKAKRRESLAIFPHPAIFSSRSFTPSYFSQV